MWARAPQEDWGEERYELAKELVHCGYFIGKTEAQILLTFGPSERDLIPGHWSYVLGIEHGSYMFAIDNDWVSLGFHDGIVVSAQIHPD